MPGGLVGMALLIILVESAIVRHEQPVFSTNAAMNWRFGGRMAATRAAGCDVLLFGDSQVQFNLLPRALEKWTGRRAFNLALHAGPPPASYFQLRKALASGARPKALVVDFQPNVLGMDPQGQARLFSELLRPDEAVDLAMTAGSMDLLCDTVLGSTLASYRDRHEIRSGILGLLKGQDLGRTARFWLTPLWRNWRYNLGANVFPRNPGHDASVPDDHWLAPPRWSRHRGSVPFVKKFLDLAAAERITVFWLLPPIHPAVMAERGRKGLEEPFSRFVREVQGRYPNVVVLDARGSGYGREVFADLAHLDVRGATVLSADVAAVLDDFLARSGPIPRWVMLPLYRDDPVDVPVEDIDQSRLALKITP
jgi:hypothetical protein